MKPGKPIPCALQIPAGGNLSVNLHFSSFSFKNNRLSDIISLWKLYLVKQHQKGPESELHL